MWMLGPYINALSTSLKTFLGRTLVLPMLCVECMRIHALRTLIIIINFDDHFQIHYNIQMSPHIPKQVNGHDLPFQVRDSAYIKCSA